MSKLLDISQIELNKTKDVILSYPWEDARGYGMWLAQTYHYVIHSSRLLAMATAYAPLGEDRLHSRMFEHLGEEKGHEKLCVTDLKAMGFKLEDFPRLYQSVAMAQTQYYWIQYRGAISFYGYVLALETLADAYGKELGRRILGAHGAKAAKFINLHAEEDVGHTQSAFQAVESLSPTEIDLIAENLQLSAEYYREMLRESAVRVRQSTGGRKAA